MNISSDYPVTIKMLLLEADGLAENDDAQEAAKIRGWVADFLSEQSKVVRWVWRQWRRPRGATSGAICSQNAVYSEGNGDRDAEMRSNPRAMAFAARKPSIGLRRIDKSSHFPQATAIAVCLN